ncbi:MAG: hypothetical protein KDB80_05440 [Planctomycetes bacterium]|nr:hypothetical protein [Planctomycetota bacterium]
MTETLIFLGGLAQLAVAAASLAIPRVLNWKEQTRRLDGLTRQVFWTYAAYIFTTNVCFGVVSVAAPGWLTDGSGLARSVCAFIAVYWGARVIIQFTSYRPHRPTGTRFVLAEIAVVVAFVFCTVVYGVTALGLW